MLPRLPRALPGLVLLLLFAFGAGALAAAATDEIATERAAEPTSERARLAARAARVEILRDDFGVPHIYGKSDADAVFGMLYAQAEDDFPRIERNYVWALGRLAEIEGEKALFSDLRARLYMTHDEARAAFRGAPAWLRALCEAFADGLNWYLLTHPEVEPKVLDRFEPWMPILFFEGSIGGDIEQVPLAGIEAFYGREGPVAPGALRAEGTADDPLGPPQGSNGIAIAPSRTRAGDTLLLINPHTSFYFRGELHVVSDEGLNAYGAVTWGQFFVYQGFNERTGWMHTSTHVDFIDEFVETVAERDGRLWYRYGDEWRPVWTSEVTLRVFTDDGTEARTFPLYRTHHGPITHQLDGRWVATRINWEPAKALAQSFRRTKQTNHAGFRDVLELRTNSSNNTVYADADGTIAYYHGNFVPRRDPSFAYDEPVDGSNPATDWQGRHEIDELVHIVDPANGWLQNCNSTPFTAAGAHSPDPAKFPRYMAPDLEQFRGIQAVRLLSTADDLTLEGLIALAYDPYLVGFETLLAGLFAAWDAQGEDWPALAAPIETLRAWDRRVALDSVAMTLGHFYGWRYVQREGHPEGLRGMALVEHLGTGTAPSERLEVFAATIAELTERFGRWAVPWGEVNRFQRLSGAIDLAYDDTQASLPVPMANGSWGALASFSALPGEDTQRIYGRSGNSFVAVVSFGERVRAKSLLAGGQSGDPASPHFDDQAKRYVEAAFKDVAFYREDVERRAEGRYRPGLGPIAEAEEDRVIGKPEAAGARASR